MITTIGLNKYISHEGQIYLTLARLDIIGLAWAMASYSSA